MTFNTQQLGVDSGSLLLGSRLSLQLFALSFVLLLPVVLLAIGSAIEGLLACAAHLVLSDVTLWCTTEVALFHKSYILLAFFRGLCIEL